MSKVSVARYYDAATAQFLTRDPIEPITRQPYQYAAGDPLDMSDAYGLWPSWHSVAGVLDKVSTGLGVAATAADAVGLEPVGAVLGAGSAASAGLAAGAQCFSAGFGDHDCQDLATKFVWTTATAGISAGLSRGLHNAEEYSSRYWRFYRARVSIDFVGYDALLLSDPPSAYADTGNPCQPEGLDLDYQVQHALDGLAQGSAGLGAPTSLVM